jgi:hypothetical protein
MLISKLWILMFNDWWWIIFDVDWKLTIDDLIYERWLMPWQPNTRVTYNLCFNWQLMNWWSSTHDAYCWLTINDFWCWLIFWLMIDDWWIDDQRPILCFFMFDDESFLMDGWWFMRTDDWWCDLMWLMIDDL